MLAHEFNEAFKKTDSQNMIGYPVHIFFIDLSKMYMQRIRWHWHGDTEVIIINHGEAEFLSDDTSIRLHAGDGIFINQNVIHSIHPVEDTANCSIYSITFDPLFLLGYGETLLTGKYIVPILSCPDLKTLLLSEKESWQEKMLDIMNDTIAVNLTRKYGYELMTKSNLCQFWVQLLEHLIPENITLTGESFSSADENRVKDVILYVEKHFKEPVSLEQLANSVHISRSECCRCFKRTLNMTPIEYLMKYRILQAANYILNGNQKSSISNLAFSVGFNNVSYFNKIFKQYLKCTPSQYRQLIKKDPSAAVGISSIFNS